MTYTVLRILTYVLGIVGTALALPLMVAYLEGEEKMIGVFAFPMAVAWASSLIFMIRARGKPNVLGIQEAFGVVGVLWLVICLFGAVPLYFSGEFNSLTDAVFESVSGFTTTGATILSDVETLPRSVNLWRCQTHWLGGMGVVALAVAMIPLLGAGGFRLIKAEATGPDKDKFTSSITTTAKLLWFVYCGLTALMAIILWRMGLDYIDSLALAFSTLATGGFSMYNASVGAFNNPDVTWVCTVFMFLSSISFILYGRLFTRRFPEVLANSELRAFILIVAVSSLAVWLIESVGGRPEALGFRDASFGVVSMISTSGFMVSDYTTWLPASQMVLLLLCFTGACSGSTSGGVKIVRWIILAKQFVNEMRRLIHPYGVFTLRLNGTSGREVFVPIVAAFFFAYFALVAVTAFFGALAGLGPFTSFSVALSMVGNIGPAFGDFGPQANYGSIPMFLKWWYMFAMLAGRLEIYTLLILIGALGVKKRRNKII